MKQDVNLPQIDILFVSATHNLAEECYNCVKNAKITDEFRIIPRYYSLDKGESKPDLREDMIVCLHADSKSDIDKIKPEWSLFQKVKHRVFCGNNEDAKNWLSSLNDSGLRVFIGKKEENLSNFREYLRSTGLAREATSQVGSQSTQQGTVGTAGVKNY